MDPTYFIGIKFIIMALAALCLFFCAAKRSVRPFNRFFFHYSLGFGLLAVQQAIPALIISGNQVHFGLYSLFILGYFLSASTAYLLFLRATLVVISRNRFFTTVTPFFLLLSTLIINFMVVFVYKQAVINVATIFMLCIIIPAAAFLGNHFAYLFFKNLGKIPFWQNFPHLPLSFAWFFSMAISIRFWVVIQSLENPDFWVLSTLASEKTNFLRISFYVILFASTLAFSLAKRKKPSLKA